MPEISHKSLFALKKTEQIFSLKEQCTFRSQSRYVDNSVLSAIISGITLS